MGKLEEMIGEIREFTDKLQDKIFVPKFTLDKINTFEGIKFKQIPYFSRKTILEDPSDWESFAYGSTWGLEDTHFCFRVKLEIPQELKGREVVFFLSTGADDIWNTDNPQMLIYINGVRRCGMDMNHNSVTIFEKEDWENGKDRVVDIGIYAYSNLAKDGNNLTIEIAAKNEELWQLYFDLVVPLEAVENIIMTEDYDSAVALEVAEDLKKAIDMAKEPLKASNYLRENVYGKTTTDAVVKSVGHTHIDVAWKWRLRQTREKVIRSYSTVMEYMKKYPEYIFMASTPQMYEFVKEEEPELFEEILNKVKEGKFEPEGAMWLEADCNLTSGESLVRQILYGKRYFKKVFGVDSEILWLPDVFGYSAAMPQILLKSRIKSFMTTKLAWNDTNRFPYDLFFFKGIDGSKVLSYIISTCDYQNACRAAADGGRLEYTYNGRQNPTQIMGTEKAFREKNLTKNYLTCYGFGDGGGGPTTRMLEMDRRMNMGVPFCPRTEKTTVKSFFDDLHKELLDKTDKVPVWDGELYLEYHRGTYTSIGKIKKNNRRAEYQLLEAETYMVLDYLLNGNEYDREKAYSLWKTVMLNHFHDILPGSSIKEVYEDSDKQYKQLFDEIKELDEVCSEEILHTESYVLNENAKENKVVNSKEAIENKNADDKLLLETSFYTISFDLNGEIESLYDKELDRQIRDLSAHPLNRLIAFKDVPKDYDCWNIDSDFEDEFENVLSVDSIQAENDKVVIERSFRSSKIRQEIIFYQDSKRIDFKTRVSWHEHQTLLKAAFPVDVEAKEIRCEIQYGNLVRNLTRDNSFDKAKFECCAHKWIDITSEDGSYGVAILNDCKYGYDAKEKLMRLTLIKSGIFPNPEADQGEHEFTYSLLPHKGDYIKGSVNEEAINLNLNSHLFDAEIFERAKNAIINLENAKGVFISAIKMAEDSNDIIIRFYDGYGLERDIRFGLFEGVDSEILEVKECNLLEENLEASESDSSFDKDKKEMSMHIRPYDIRTIKVISK